MATATAFVSAIAVLPSCTMGNAFVVSPIVTKARTVRRATSTRCTTPTTEDAEKKTISFEQVNDDEINDHDDDGDDDDEDDIHPSVAWLYQPSMSPATPGKGNSNARKPLRRTLAVDFGTRRVGLAIGVGIAPRVVPGITNRGDDLEVVRQVLVRARGEGIRDVVVGLPLVRQVLCADIGVIICSTGMT